MKKTKKLTVSVGIPAFNEAANIKNILSDVLSQKEEGFVLHKIFVLNDGSTDKTVEFAKSFKDKRIAVINDGKRLGKPTRLNQLYKLSKSEILVTFDADIRLLKHNALNKLVSGFENNEVGLVGGNVQPAKPSGFFEKVAATSANIWYETRKNINKGDSVRNHIGRISALRSRLYKNLKIPSGMAADDLWLYFETKRLGFKFKFVNNVVATYAEPKNLNDYLIQSARYKSYKSMILKYFGNEIKNDFETSFSNKIKGITKTMKREPFFTPLALILQVFIKLSRNNLKTKYQGSLWTKIDSTKKFNSNQHVSGIDSNPTITVGIPAHNEEANISKLVQNILSQSNTNHRLEKILIVSDGSTDNTVASLKKIKSKKITIIDRKIRLGGGKTKDEVLKRAKSDILVLLDADVMPVNKEFINEMVKPIMKGASLVGANTIPLPARNYFGKMVANSHMFKKYIYQQINSADNVYLCHGRGRAFHKSLYKTIKLPDSSSEDAYSYLYAKKNNFNFAYAPLAKVYYSASSVVKERELQSKRFLKSKESLLRFFDKKYVKDNFKIPTFAFLKGFGVYIFTKPLLTMFYFVWLGYIFIFSKINIKENGKWTMALSSKKLT